jgi:flagellar motility protein MotE (MotC chaperone)
MTRFRVLSAAAGAAACLLAIKGIAILREQTDDRPRAAAPGEIPHFGRAIARARQGYVPQDPDITGALPSKPKDEKKPDPAAMTTAQAPPPPAGTPINLDAPRGSATERAVLERLGERREEIEGRAREMDTREALLRAAEKQLDSRVTDLKSLEERLLQTSENRNESQAGTLKNLVVMYETMKPKDAAKVFDRLDLKVLIPVVQKMNPRKMSEILAAMSPEAAERLTVALATRGDAAGQPAQGAANELPRIDAPPTRAPAPAAAPAQPPRR